MASWVKTGASKTIDLSIISLPHPKLPPLLHIRMRITRMPTFITRLKHNPITKIGIKNNFQKRFLPKVNFQKIKKDANQIQSSPNLQKKGIPPPLRHIIRMFIKRSNDPKPNSLIPLLRIILKHGISSNTIHKMLWIAGILANIFINIIMRQELKDRSQMLMRKPHFVLMFVEWHEGLVGQPEKTRQGFFCWEGILDGKQFVVVILFHEGWDLLLQLEEVIALPTGYFFGFFYFRVPYESWLLETRKDVAELYALAR